MYRLNQLVVDIIDISTTMDSCDGALYSDTVNLDIVELIDE